MNLIMNSSNATFTSNGYVLHDLTLIGHTGVLIRLTSNDLTENYNLSKVLVDDSPEDILLYDKEVKLYIPGCKL